MAMKKATMWIALCAAALLAIAVLQQRLYEPPYLGSDPEPINAKSHGELQATPGFPADTAAVKPAASSQATPPIPIAPTNTPTDPSRPSSNSVIDGVVQDTGEFIDANAPIPPQDGGDAPEPRDTGPFIPANQ